MVSNFTDVDDKIIKKAKEENMTEKELAQFFIEAYLKDVDRLGTSLNFIKPKVTEMMGVIVDYIQKLIEKDYAYEVDGDVYFRIGKIKEYGLLSGQKIDELEVGARIEENSKKESPLDFVLWKRTTEGVTFPSPFGAGRPGWHTECVAMIDELFNNKKIDIHGGGSDLKFPHHENEIAQCLAMNNHTVANYWMHNGRLNIDNEKMSKSEGNVIWVKDLENPQAFRLMMLRTHYRSPLNFTAESLESSVKEWGKIVQAYKGLAREIDLEEEIKSFDVLKDEIDEFVKIMSHDFNTPNAITLLFDLVKQANKAIKGDTTVSKIEVFNTMSDILEVLGLAIPIRKMDANDRALYHRWLNAKGARNFEEADRIRGELIEKGII